MIDSVPPWLWVVFTLLAAGTQVARNTMQRGLTSELGTTGATHVRFLFGLPFAMVFLAVAWALCEWPVMQFSATYFYWLALGALSQILATAWMLSAMQSRSFVVTTAAVKTEPVQAAVFGAVMLNEQIGPVAMSAVVIATMGVVLMSWPETEVNVKTQSRGVFGTTRVTMLRWSPILVGISAGGMFALSAVGFRGAILSLSAEGPDVASFYIRATTTLACGLLFQTIVLSAYLVLTDRGTLLSIFKAWRPSMLAGLAGATASQFWFLAIAIESVSRVRTLALVEVLFAQIVSRRIFAQDTSRLEGAGILLILIGVIILLNS